ncbi:MAG TPA: DUF2804 domain-containing protein [bacterium]|nr:DUF2804 domain-containing protein [bacterium]
MMIDRREFMRLCAGAAAFGSGMGSFFLKRALADMPLLDDSYPFFCPELIEITKPGPIIAPDGSCVCGWARRPILELNFDDAKFASSKQVMKKAFKKWDMYHIYTPELAMQFLVAWIPYAAFFNANIYVRATNRFYEDTRFLPANPEIEMMPDSGGGRTVFDAGPAKAVFEVVGDIHKLSVRFDNFSTADKEAADLNLSGGEDSRTSFNVEAEMSYPANHASIAGVHMTNPRRCHYGHKINCMETEGSVEFGGNVYRMSRENSFAALDFGRGHYPKKMFWHWATASGRHSDGKLIGFNLGFGNSPKNTTENALFYDGKLTKVNAVECLPPPDSDLEKPCLVRDFEGLADLTFKPLKTRRIDTKIGSGYSRGRPALGLYSGTIASPDGGTLVIKDLFGLYEWVDSNW